MQLKKISAQEAERTVELLHSKTDKVKQSWITVESQHIAQAFEVLLIDVKIPIKVSQYLSEMHL